MMQPHDITVLAAAFAQDAAGTKYDGAIRFAAACSGLPAACFLMDDGGIAPRRLYLREVSGQPLTIDDGTVFDQQYDRVQQLHATMQQQEQLQQQQHQQRQQQRTREQHLEEQHANLLHKHQHHVPAAPEDATGGPSASQAPFAAAAAAGTATGGASAAPAPSAATAAAADAAAAVAATAEIDAAATPGGDTDTDVEMGAAPPSIAEAAAPPDFAPSADVQMSIGAGSGSAGGRSSRRRITHKPAAPSQPQQQPLTPAGTSTPVTPIVSMECGMVAALHNSNPPLFCFGPAAPDVAVLVPCTPNA